MGFVKFRLCIGSCLLRSAIAGALLLSGGQTYAAQTNRPSENADHPDVQKIVRDASWNELHSSGPPRQFRFRLAKSGPKGSTVKLIVETKDGEIARLIEKNGQPLTPEENATELARLNNLLAHPEIQQHRHQKEVQDNARGDEMVRMLPDAFIYTYAGMVQRPDGACYRFTFRPNPSFVPPDREGEVYHGMEGELWVNKSQERLAKIDAHLISDVNFGWGVIGKLYKGGSILVEDADVGSNHWETTLLKLRLQGKILMMKSVDFSTTEISTDFHQVPADISYQDAIRLLEAYKPS